MSDDALLIRPAPLTLSGGQGVQCLVTDGGMLPSPMIWVRPRVRKAGFRVDTLMQYLKN